MAREVLMLFLFLPASGKQCSSIDVSEREDTASEKTPMQWHEQTTRFGPGTKKSTVLRFEDGARRLGIDDLALVS